MPDSYANTRSKLETYFDRTASKTWERLTSDAPVSRIRATVRAGRDEMRAMLLAALPEDLAGARVLDAGCGAGQMSCALAERGAEVVGVDISPSLLAVAKARTPGALAGRIRYEAGDMIDPERGRFDYIVAMDSLIHYRPADTAAALSKLAAAADRSVVFTIAPKTPLLSAMHLAGKLFPRSDRSPAIVPTSPRVLQRHLMLPLKTLGRVNTGFYKSQAMELPA